MSLAADHVSAGTGEAYMLAEPDCDAGCEKDILLPVARHANMFEPFQKFVPIAANRCGISREMHAAKICHDFRMLIPEIFKNTVSPEKHIQPAHFKNSTLTINVENSAWGQEVIIRKDCIIKEMNGKAGKTIIKNLRTQLHSY